MTPDTPAPPSPQDFRQLHRLDVRWAEVDAQGVVFNAHYLMYFDTALSAYWRAMGVSLADLRRALGGLFYLRRAEVDYRQAARLDDQLAIGLRCSHIGRSSLSLQGAIFRQDTLLAQAALVQVWSGLEFPARAQPVPVLLRELVADFDSGKEVLTLRLGDWDALGAAASFVRQAVFVQEQGIPPELEWDDADVTSLHAVVFNRLGDAVATGRLLPDGHIGRLAVRRESRGSGVGQRLVQTLMQRARQAGHAEALLNAQTRAAGFYRRLGFTERGEGFMDAGIPHIEMRCALTSL